MTGETPDTSLRDDLAEAFDAQSNIEGDPPGSDAPPDAAAPPADDPNAAAIQQLPALEPPSMWGPKYKEAFSKLASEAEKREIAEAWANQWKETQGYQTKKDQEFADLRKQFDPLKETLAPYEQVWQRQGMTTQQGVSQLLGWAHALATNPQQTLQELAKSYNVNLQELVSSQPYQDPQVQALQAELAQVRQQLGGFTQSQQQQQQQYVLSQIQAFENAQDEQGNLKHPHYSRVFDTMVALARGGAAKDIEDAYQKAVALDKDLQAELQQQAEQQRAAAQAAEAKKAAQASRKVQGKSTEAGEKPQRTLREDLAANMAAMSSS